MAGNHGRLLDPRRTPVSIVAVLPRTGCFVIAIEAFEDRGAHWEVPFEEVGNYQFTLDSATASAAEVDRFREAIMRFDRPLSIACDPARSRETLSRIERCSSVARAWIDSNGRFAAGSRPLGLDTPDGPPLVREGLRRFMVERGVGDVEAEFTRRYVSNPGAGEMIKAHRVVMAELGIAPYEGTVMRDPAMLSGAFDRGRRASHIEWRLAFVRALFRAAGQHSVVLYRGVALEGPPRPSRCGTFVSASFDQEVALSCLGPPDHGGDGIMIRQMVPVERLFMTYVETDAMNRQFKESEAVLIWEAGNALF